MPKALDFFIGKKSTKKVYESVKKVEEKSVVIMTKRDPQPKWD